MKESDLLNLRKIDCNLEGHPTPVSQEFFASFLLSCCLMESKKDVNNVFVLPCIFFFFFRNWNLSMLPLDLWDRAWGLPVEWLILANTLTNPG